MPRRQPERTGYRDGIPIGIGNGFHDAWQRGDVNAGIGAAFAFVDLDDAPAMVRDVDGSDLRAPEGAAPAQQQDRPVAGLGEGGRAFAARAQRGGKGRGERSLRRGDGHDRTQFSCAGSFRVRCAALSRPFGR